MFYSKDLAMRNGKHVILHIDDNQDCLDTVHAILESEGYILVQARSAEDGLKAFDESRPDLIIVDLMMDEVDAGVTFTGKLAAKGNTAPIFMLSGVGQELTQQVDTSALGLAGVFQKPVDPEMLVNALRCRLGR
jgi:DNA-binding response OmpR family regulator